MKKDLRGHDRPHIFIGAGGNENGNLLLQRQAFNFETDTPPPHIMQYSEAPDRHLATGKQQAAQMKALLASHGYGFQPGHRFMDFGCANGRVLRWLKDWAEAGEGWGVDINANTLDWCIEHLAPPFHFAVTSTTPHLPFEQRYFNLIFCNSVFTHIDDMFFSWLQELRRVIAIGGYLFVTILDESAVDGMRDKPNSFLFKRFGSDPDLQAFGTSGADFLALRRAGGKGIVTVVKADYFERLVSPWFDKLATLTQTVGGLQTGYLLKRRA